MKRYFSQIQVVNKTKIVAVFYLIQKILEKIL